MAPEHAARPIAARAAFGIFGAVLLLHFAATIAGWQNPQMPGNTFRQSQTALTTYFVQHTGDYSLAYPTPVLGKPWSIPMEFPLYEWAVAGCANLTGAPLIECARFVTLLCFYATLPAVWLLLRTLGVDRARSWLVLAFVPACPVYVFYSRAFLIESMALMFAFWFVAALSIGLDRRHRGWLIAAGALGVAAALVKITTLMLFLIPVGAAVCRQGWIALRGPSSAQPTARAWLRRAITAVTPLVIASAAWIIFSDRVKARNPAADMLRSGPQRSYNFGHFADRFSGDYWSRWLNLSSRAVISPWVFCAIVATAVLGPRRWRMPIIAAIALFALAPAIFPFLYAWHDYYYYANAAFMTLAIGFAAVAVLDSRLPRWLAIGAIVSALALQARLYAVHYRPDQLVENEYGSGLTQLLHDLTDSDDVLVVAGQDWSSMLPYATRRRALMIRNGYEFNYPYLERAFDDLNGEFVAALVLTGETRTNARLLDLAVAKLDLHPEPFLEFRDSKVYVNRGLRDEWSNRSRSFAYDGIHVLQPSSPEPPVLSGSVADLHGKAVFSGMSPSPVRFEVPFTLATLEVGPRLVFNSHATTRLWFQPATGRRRATIEFGIVDGAWQRPDKTDGVEFAVSVIPRGGPPVRVWSRLLNPVSAKRDRGLQGADFSFDLPPGAEVELAALPGPAGNNSYDWAYLASFRLR